MASTGSTRTARHTGMTVATIGSVRPIRMARTGTNAYWNDVTQIGSGRMPRNSDASAWSRAGSLHAKGHTEQGDLQAHQHRPHGQLPGGDTQRHADTVLASLRLHDPVHEVEGGERHRAEEREPGDQVPHLLVVADVLVEHPVGGDVVSVW